MWNEAWEMSRNKGIDEETQSMHIKSLYLLGSKLKTFVLQMTLLRKGKASYDIGEILVINFSKNKFVFRIYK